MAIWIVRHACAGHRADWGGPDDLRPLDPSGIEQAHALARELRSRAIGEILSSPALRCVDTVAPLGGALGLPVMVDDRLREPDGAGLLAQVRRCADGTVVCTHGEVMQPVLDVLRNEGLDTDGDHSDADLLLKGAAWELEQAAGRWRLALCAPIPRVDCPRHVDSL